MPTATNSVTIGRPIEVVFAFVADGEKCTQWRSGVLDIKRVSGEGVGPRKPEASAREMRAERPAAP